MTNLFRSIRLPAALLVAAVTAVACSKPAATPSSPADDFLAALRSHCGNAYEGTVINPQPNDADMLGETLVMHVRECGDTVRVPFHVGEDRSRTWVFTRTAEGVRLKHDHRHEDGSEDEVTQYGGDSRDTGTASMMQFAADEYTGNLLPISARNVWTVEITSTQYIYDLQREDDSGRHFRVEFDLTRPVDPPPAPWGYENQ